MPNPEREQFCDWCGESIGFFTRYGREPQSCGQRECERECRDMERSAEADARERAAADDWERYR